MEGKLYVHKDFSTTNSKHKGAKFHAKKAPLFTKPILQQKHCNKKNTIMLELWAPAWTPLNTNIDLRAKVMHNKHCL